MCLGEKLKELRALQNKTQQQIADLVGVAKSTYSLYESGKREPNVRTLKKIATALNTTGDILLSIEEPYGQQDTLKSELNENHKALVMLYDSCSKLGQQRILEYAQKIFDIEQVEKSLDIENLENSNLSTSSAEATDIALALRSKNAVIPKANKV